MTLLLALQCDHPDCTNTEVLPAAPDAWSTSVIQGQHWTATLHTHVQPDDTRWHLPTTPPDDRALCPEHAHEPA